MDEETRRREILEDGGVSLKGGRGGLGNSHLKPPPTRFRICTTRRTGREAFKIIELKSITMVWWVSQCGQSTPLSSITVAKPKIADYALPQFVPQLGMVEYRDGKVSARRPSRSLRVLQKARPLAPVSRHIERNSILHYFWYHDNSKDYGGEFKITNMNWNDITPRCCKRISLLPSVKRICSTMNCKRP